MLIIKIQMVKYSVDVVIVVERCRLFCLVAGGGIANGISEYSCK